VAWNADLSPELDLAPLAQKLDLVDYLIGNQTPQGESPLAKGQFCAIIWLKLQFTNQKMKATSVKLSVYMLT
jgi:hypothetical protein